MQHQNIMCSFRSTISILSQGLMLCSYLGHGFHAGHNLHCRGTDLAWYEVTILLWLLLDKLKVQVRFCIDIVSFDDELMSENIIYGMNKKGMLFNEWNTYCLCLCFALFFTLHKRARLRSANLPRLLAALGLFCVLNSYVTSIRGILNIYNLCCTFLLVFWSTVQDCLGIFSSLAHSVALGSLQIISVTQLATSSSTSSPW